MPHRSRSWRNFRRGSYASLNSAARRSIAILAHAPGNDAPIGGIKVVTANAWFAARPSGTEDIYKIYAESFRGQEHLRRIIDEAQAVINDALAASSAG